MGDFSSTVATEPVIDLDDDENFARELQERLDQEDVIDLSDTELTDAEIAQQLQAKYDEELARQSLNDPQIDDEVQFVGIQQTPVAVPQSLVIDDDDESDIVVTDSGRETVLIEELGERVDLYYSSEWTKFEFKINVKAIWNTFNTLYFNNYQPFEDVDINWSSTLGRKACEIKDSELILHDDLKLCQRAELISVLLRSMVIMYLKKKFKFTEESSNFKVNFIKIRKHINSIWLFNIRADDTMENNREIDRRQWYRCNGICQHRSPFYGLYRSENPPSGANIWWVSHNDRCGATLFRIYEAVSTVTGRRQFLANTMYMNVKIDEKNLKQIKPKEVFDLTDDEPPRLPTPTTIDIGDSDLSEQCDNSEPSRVFFQNFDQSLGSDYDAYRAPCPICKDKVPRKLFCSHLDGCQGYDTTVPISRTAALRLAALPSTSSVFGSSRSTLPPMRRSSDSSGEDTFYNSRKRPRLL